MADNFFKKDRCDRCGGSLADGRTMSMFNTDCLCTACKRKEMARPDYQKAVEAEIAAERRGDRYFPGIGLKD